MAEQNCARKRISVTGTVASIQAAILSISENLAKTSTLETRGMRASTKARKIQSCFTVSAFDNRGTYTHICVYNYTQMPSQLHTIACSRLGANLYLKQFLEKLLMLKSQA